MRFAYRAPISRGRPLGEEPSLREARTPIIAGVAAGVFRDLLCGLQPTVLKQDLYATPSLGGGLVYALGHGYLLESSIMIVAFVPVAASRMIEIYMQARTERSAERRPR